MSSSQSIRSASAISNPNIAFIKYWGNRDAALSIPSNGSISMNLDGLFTRTQVTFDASLLADTLILDEQPTEGAALKRVSAFLDLVRSKSGTHQFARVESSNNFPMGAGIASSASAFAALSLAASTAAGLNLDEAGLSRLARQGSGSACRSVPAGFVEWLPGRRDEDSYAVSIASPDHWDLTDCVVIVSTLHKPVGSQEGHSLADTSPLQAARVADTPRRLDVCRKAILRRDFESFSQVIEQDCNLMHAVMMTSTPQLLYWQPQTMAIMQAVSSWRRSGLPVCYTIDAGPNVHVLCPTAFAGQVMARLNGIPGVSRVIPARPGGSARLVP